MSKPIIGYITENADDYVKGLKAAQTAESLRSLLTKQRYLANDAYKIVTAPDFNFDEFQRGRKLENSGHYAGDEWSARYGAILMPEILIRVSILAEQYKVPWGLAYIRYRDAGNIVEGKQFARWNENEGQQ